MSYTITLKKGDVVYKKDIIEILKEHDQYFEKLTKKWMKAFSFDASIDQEDLMQELRIKLYNELHTYDYTNSNLKTCIYEITKNFLINKRRSLITRNSHPTTFDGKTMMILSLYDTVDAVEMGLFNEESLFRINCIDSGIYTPLQGMEYKEGLQIVRDRLNTIVYKPGGFTRRLRSFSLYLFDLLYDHNSGFWKFVVFDHRCINRYRLNTGEKRHREVVIPTAEIIAHFLRINKRSVNVGMGIIRRTLRQYLTDINS